MDHSEEVGGELVVARGYTAEVLQLGEEALDEVAFTVESLAEARFPATIAFRRDVGCGTLLLDQLSDTISIVSFVGQHDGMRSEMVKQAVGDLPVVRLSSG